MAKDKKELDSPVSRRDQSDPGDSTGQNFRYQYAYGVVLLIGTARGDRDYQAVWCEQHEDFLGEINPNLFDAFQIKTQQPENGWWQHNSEPYWKSIQRFVRLEQKYPGKFRNFYFVSNTRPLNTTDEHKIYQSPSKILSAVSNATGALELVGKEKEGFEYLCKQASLQDGETDTLFNVLKRLIFIDGPDRVTFITALAHEHIPSVDGFTHLTAVQLDAVAEHLINLVASASSLGSQDPERFCVALGTGLDPQLQHKRIDLPRFLSVCQTLAQPDVAFPAELSTSPLGADTTKLDRFFKKLTQGGFVEDEVEAFRRQTILAHGRLLELATREADGGEFVRLIENLVLDECNAAKIAVSTDGQKYGKEMFLKLRQELQSIAQNQPRRVKRAPYEVLMGMAGLLTEDCTVWWSDKFDLTKDS